MINGILWAIASSLIITSGIYYTFKLKGIQFKFNKMIKSLFKKNKEVSNIQSLMMSLAGRIGIGSIAGIALAIYIGGIGSIFWMWITTFLCAPNTYVETFLAIKYKEKNIGGPSYYISKGLKNNTLASLYAVILIICYIGGFLAIQTNTITKSLNIIINIKPYFIGIIIVLTTSFIIFKGSKQIIETTTILVPIMTLLYILLAIIVVVKNINQIPLIFFSIIKESFKMKPFFTGFMVNLIIGLQRGIFSNESGLGTSGIAATTTSSNKKEEQGYNQMLGIYITTLIICTATALIILTSNYKALTLKDINGIEITQYAFRYHFKKFGDLFIFLSIFLFSFSTIITGYYYSETSLKYFKENNNLIYLLKIITLIVLFLGCLISSKILWSIVDSLIAVLSIINIYSILKLKDKIIN